MLAKTALRRLQRLALASTSLAVACSAEETDDIVVDETSSDHTEFRLLSNPLENCKWERGSLTSNSTTVWTVSHGLPDEYAPIGAGCHTDDLSARIVSTYYYFCDMDGHVNDPCVDINPPSGWVDTYDDYHDLFGDTQIRCAAYLPNGSTATVISSACDYSN